MSGGRVTLTEVARRSGVSIATASFVLSGRRGRPAGSPATRERVQRIAAELGYRPNAHARAMRTGRSDTIALALGAPRDFWADELANVVTAKAKEAGLTTVVLTSDDWFDLLSVHHFDCAFVNGIDGSSERHRQALTLARQGSRLVAFSSESTASHYDVVASSPATAVREARDLLRSRHDRVHFMATETGVPSEARNISRQHVFADAASAAGDDPQGLVVAVPPELGPARLAALEWLRSSDRPTAVVVQTGPLALALQAAALQCGISVPDDLEIISIGALPEASELFGPVTCYDAPHVFDRIAEVVVARAVTAPDAPFVRLDLEWSLKQGATTRP